MENKFKKLYENAVIALLSTAKELIGNGGDRLQTVVDLMNTACTMVWYWDLDEDGMEYEIFETQEQINKWLEKYNTENCIRYSDGHFKIAKIKKENPMLTLKNLLDIYEDFISLEALQCSIYNNYEIPDNNYEKWSSIFRGMACDIPKKLLNRIVSEKDFIRKDVAYFVLK